MIARSLGPSVVKLSLDPNGNHVVQRALQHMPAPRNDFVLEAITASLVQVSYYISVQSVYASCWVLLLLLVVVVWLLLLVVVFLV